MTPYSEPNSLPNIFDNWLDWRMAYAEHVKAFENSRKDFSDKIKLEIRLKHLGFYGVNLQNELKHVCTPHQ